MYVIRDDMTLFSIIPAILGLPGIPPESMAVE